MTRTEQARIDSAIAALAEQVKKMSPDTAVALKAERDLGDYYRASIETLVAERDLLRAALVKLVGVDGRVELEQLEAVMRLMPAPAEATIDAIHALIATLEAR